MFLNATADINTFVALANQAKNLVNPETFYNKQLLDTIRIDAKEYVYYGLADSLPIEGKADKFTIRRWSPLQAHTVPLVEGIPPMSDKGSVERFELTAYQYGRYMEFSDIVDLKVVDPVIAHYTKEYSLVVLETLDMLAREALFMVANAYFAGGAATFETLKIPVGTTANAKPNMLDLRQIVLAFKRSLVKPRVSGKYRVICSAEFTYDMVSDATVEKFMNINQTTKDMYDGSVLFPMFGMDFQETMMVPTHGEFYKMVDGASLLHKRLVQDVSGTLKYVTINENTFLVGSSGAKVCTTVNGYVNDPRTGLPASYIPNQKVWNLAGLTIAAEDGGSALTGWEELKVHHILIIGKDALARTGLQGEGQARMYVKAKGSAGVLDPIDQRQSIGFKINSVGFGSIRTEAVVDYMCIPTQANMVTEFITQDVGFVGPDDPAYVPASNQRDALLASVGKLAEVVSEAQAEFFEMTLTSAAGSTTIGSTALTPSVVKATGQSYYTVFAAADPELYSYGSVLPASLGATKQTAITDVAAGGLAKVALYIVDDATGVIIHSAGATVTAKAS